MKLAVCPGSFDPITVGHLDLARRAAAIFDQVILCVMVNSEKHPMFSLEERLELARAAAASLPAVRAEARPRLDTILLPARPEHAHISSTMVREMIRYRQPLDRYIPADAMGVLDRIRQGKV